MSLFYTKNSFYTPFESVTSLVQVNNSKSGDKTKYYCELCTKNQVKPDPYESETEVEIHKQIHHRYTIQLNGERNDGNMCLICLEDFETRDELTTHVKVSHLYSSEDSERIEREIFVCHECNYIFFNKALLGVHVENSHKPFMSRPAESLCPHCNILIGKNSLWHHFEMRGLKSVSTCPFCFLKFQNRNELYTHVKKHPPFLQCEVCKYQTPKRDNFKKHLTTCKSNGKININNLRNYYVDGWIPQKWTFKVNFVPRGLNVYGMVLICVFCRHICQHEKDLKKHLEDVHAEKQFVLDLVYHNCACGERFSNKLLFRHHLFKNGEGHYELGSEEQYRVIVQEENGDDSDTNDDSSV